MLVTGVDIIEIDRVERVFERYGERFLRRIYCEGEILYARGRAPQLASRFAAKEAVMKLLGTGVRGVRWRDIEVVRHPGMAPHIVLHWHRPSARRADRSDRHRAVTVSLEEPRRRFGGRPQLARKSRSPRMTAAHLTVHNGDFATGAIRGWEWTISGRGCVTSSKTR